MSDLDESTPEIAHVGCMAAVVEPAVPSDKAACSLCGTEVWLSHALQVELMEQGFNVDCRCALTCMPDFTDDIELTVTAAQREHLHTLGIDDDDIDMLLSLVTHLNRGLVTDE